MPRTVVSATPAALRTLLGPVEVAAAMLAEETVAEDLSDGRLRRLLPYSVCGP